MRDGKIQRVFVGADRIALNGDFANKIGTYSVAVLAKFHNVPFHAVAPVSTVRAWRSLRVRASLTAFSQVDIDCKDGSRIEIEQRSAAEVQGVNGSFGLVRWAPQNSPVHNPAFDVTPGALVTSLILDTGVYTAAELQRNVLATLKQFKHGGAQ